MHLTAALPGTLEAQVEAEIARGGRALRTAANRTNDAMKNEVRGHVQRVYGDRLAKTWRGKVYDNPGTLAPAVYQWSKAPRQMENLTGTGPIKSPTGFWLPIPTDEARRLFPARMLRSRKRSGAAESAIAKVEQRVGTLQFVMPRGSGRGKRAYLVANSVRERSRKAKSGPTRTLSKARKLKSGGYGKGATSVVMFILVPQVRRVGHLDLNVIKAKYSQRYSMLIAEEWNRQ